MNLVTFNRLVKSGTTSFLRNIGVSISATSIMVITLFIISTVLVLYNLTDLSLDSAKDRVGVSVYFKDSTTKQEIDVIRSDLEAFPGVKSIIFTSKEQARDRYIERNQNRPDRIRALDELDNDTDPFPNSFAITASELTNYEPIVKFLGSDRFRPYIEEKDGIKDNRKIIERLGVLSKLIRQLGVLLTVVFIAVTIMVMFNTIRLAIYNRREEVEIMRLVGATNWYIRWPFLIEGLIYAILATAITSIVMFGLLSLASTRIEEFLDLRHFGGSLVRGLFAELFIINLLASIIIGVVSSSIAIRRYLRI
ncbi:MAG: ABC transporter permease [Candidatus Doudnabacteria bacterium]|nr:ABC transporter permease [Candidatus Doudnabacteria bacterium]